MATQAPEKQIPDHVPPELVHHISLINGADFLADPYEFLAGLHDRTPPIFYSINPTGPAWHLRKHEDAFFMLRNTEYFSNEDGLPFPRDPNDPFPMIPIEIDPPHHRKYRAILDPVFSPQGIKRMEARIRDLSNELIDEVIDKGGCEFTTAYARPLPVGIFLELMGLPQSMRDTFVTWVVDLLSFAPEERHKMAAAMKSIDAYMKEAIVEKRKNPADDVMSRIIAARPGGEPLSEKEVFGFVFFLFIAGIDTVYATMNNMWLWLARNPDRRHEIISRPNDMQQIIEELLRMWGTTFSGRRLVKDLELRGVKMKAGEKVTSILPACNYDPEVFPNPKEVDFDRTRKPILSFAGGVHACMGAHLARLEITIGMEEWLRRIPEFSLKQDAKIAYEPAGVVGPVAVPLVW